MTRRVILSGCSGGGKSTLIDHLAALGRETFPEPGRLIVQEEHANGGSALPWVDEPAFAIRAMTLAARFHAAARSKTAFYDRSIIDAVTWFEQTERPLPTGFADAVDRYRYHRLVFLVPPWPDIFVQDGERRHTLAAAEAEYASLVQSYPAKGYDIAVVPRIPVEDRIGWIVERLRDEHA